MELLQLTYFCHSAESENFSKTAEYYNVPTSNISRAVRSLERELNTKLFTRSANKISLNEQGKTFYSFVSQSLNLLNNGKNALSAENNEPVGEICILISTCRRIATQAIEECIQAYPNIKFIIKHGFEDGNYDFIISDVPPSKKQFDKINLLTERMFLAIPKASRLFGEADVTTLIENEPFISLGNGTRLHALTEQYCGALGFSPNIALQTDDPYYVRKYLEMGLGIVIFPEISWAQILSPNIKLANVGFPDRKTYVFTEKNKTLTAGKKAFLEILIKTFKTAQTAKRDGE